MWEVVRQQSAFAYDERQEYKLQPIIQFDDFSSGFPGKVSLKEKGTHVIRASLLLTGTTIKQLGGTLSSDEYQRAARFHFAKDRRRYIVCRGLLRSILGTYLGPAPGNLRLVYNASGKPGLDVSEHGNGVRFSVSHSEELALYTVAQDVLVDVDIERASRRIWTKSRSGSFRVLNMKSTGVLRRKRKLRLLFVAGPEKRPL